MTAIVSTFTLVGTTSTQGMGGINIPVTLTLTSNAVGRAIELSTNNGVSWYPAPLDSSTPEALVATVYTPITNFRATGNSGDTLTALNSTVGDQTVTPNILPTYTTLTRPSAANFGVGQAFLIDTGLVSYSDGSSWFDTPRSMTAVAGNCFINTSFDASIRQVMNETPHFACDDITALKVVFPNWYMSSSTKLETGSGGTYTIEASIQYPMGTFTRLTFSGSNTGTIPTLTSLESDFVNVNIPLGAFFTVRTYLSTPSGWCKTTLLWSGFNGNSCEYSATTVTNTVMGGNITQTTPGTGCGELAIVGLTDKPSAIVYGDSRCRGAGDVADSWLSIGNVCRSLSINRIPDGNFGNSGDSFTFTATTGNFALRAAAATYYTNIIFELGINDIFTETAVQSAIYHQLLALLPANRSVFMCTLEPYTTSSDAWSTTANQTVTGNESVRLEWNDIVRSKRLTGVSGFFDLEAASSSSFSSGKWAITDMTDDGLHANANGNLLPVINKAIDVTKLTRLIHRDKYLLVPQTIFQFTIVTAGSKTMSVALPNLLVLFTPSVGTPAYNTITYTASIGDTMTVSTPFPWLMRTFSWSNKGLGGDANTYMNKMVGMTRFTVNTSSLTGNLPDIRHCKNLQAFDVSTNTTLAAGPIYPLSNNTLMTDFKVSSTNRTGNIPDLAANVLLTTFNCTSTSASQLTGWSGTVLPATLLSIALGGNALPSATVNSILAALVAAGGVSGTITINGGTNGAPTGQGITDKSTLQGRGWTVTTN